MILSEIIEAPEILVKTGRGVVTADEFKEREIREKKRPKMDKVKARELKRKARIAQKRGKLRRKLPTVTVVPNQASALKSARRFKSHCRANGIEIGKVQHDLSNAMYYISVERGHEVFESKEHFNSLEDADKPTPIGLKDEDTVFLAWVYDASKKAPR